MRHFFNDAMTIYASPTTDEYGRQDWGSGVAVTGRFVEKNTLLYQPSGEAAMSDAIIHVSADVTLNIGSRITYDSVDYRVMKLVRPKDVSSVRFIKAFVQRLKNV